MLATPMPIAAGATDEHVDPRVALTVWAPAHGETLLGATDPGDIQSLLEERTGYRIDWLPGDRQSAFADLVVRIASGQAPDLISSMPVNYYDYMVDQQVLMPLDDIATLSEYFPSVTEASWDRAKVAGTIFGVPQGMDLPLIRQDWLKNLNVSNPTTMQEYRSVLNEFKKRDANVTPMTGVPSTVWGGFSPFCRYYRACNVYEVRDGQIVDTRVQPSIALYLATLRDLVQDGLIDSDFARHDRATASQKVVSGNAGIWSPLLWSFGDVSVFTETNPQAHYQIAGPASNEEDDIVAMTCGVDVRFSAITVDSLHQDEAMRLLTKYQDVFNSARLTNAHCSPYEGILSKAVDGIPEYDRVAEALSNLTLDTFNNIILGSDPVEHAFEIYVNEWERLGGRDAQTSVNEWWSSNK